MNQTARATAAKRPVPGHRASVLAIFLLLLTPLPAIAATAVVTNSNAPGEGFNDTTVVAPVTGNPATTLGAQRLAAFQAAANVWGEFLVSDVVIRIDARMTSLSCSAQSGVLGSAGPRGFVSRDFAEAPSPNTWYPQALTNALRGFDSDPDEPDLAANFNQDVGRTGCLEGLSWSYVIGAPAPAGTISFFDTVIHEIGHGLGVLSFADSASGALFNGFLDQYTQHLFDRDENALWGALNNAERAASAINTGGLTWDGEEVKNVADFLSSGSYPDRQVRMYAPNPLEGGSSVSHFDTVLSPNDIMEPSLTRNNERRLTNHLMLDIGWTGMAQLDVSLTDGQTVTTAGSGTSYGLVLRNEGPADVSIVNARVIEARPAALGAGGWTCSGSSGARCGTGSSSNGTGALDTLVTIPLGGQIDITLNSTIDTDFTGTLTNSVSVTLPDNIENTVSSTDSDSTTVIAPLPDAAIDVSGASGNTSESGGTASFTVTLSTEPDAPVDIAVESDDPGEGTPSTSSLRFTAQNWDTPQLVTVTGIDDAVDDGNQSYRIILEAAQSADPEYDGINPDDVTLSNTDDDTAGITVGAISGNTSEDGDSATVAVNLDSEPLAVVTVPVASSNTDEGTVAPGSLEFGPADWFIPQLITVTGVDDTLIDEAVSYEVLLGPAQSADPAYDGIDPPNPTLENLDNELPPLIFRDSFETP